MKRVYWVFCILSFTCGTLAFGQNQNTYVFAENAGIADLSAYESALNTANLNQYRKLDSRSQLKFDNGIVVELLSATEMKHQGMPVDTDKINRSEGSAAVNSVFSLHSSGILIERVASASTKKSPRK